MITPPSINGSCGMSMSRALSPWCISQMATTTAAATITMNEGFQNTSVSTMAPTRTTAEPMAAGRSRPARLGFFAGSPG